MTSTPSTTQYLVVDTSVLVAVVDSQDKFHAQANTLATAAQVRQYQLIYFDCVVIETIGVLCRRAEEQKRSATLPALLTSLEYLVPPSRISWTGGHLPRATIVC